MRAGAREYFTLPVAAAEVASAIERAATRSPATPVAGVKTSGQVFVFLGSKGGCGVTSIAANFALLVAQESTQNTLLIDFGQPLGDAGINIGMASANYSTANALQDPNRLDTRFLSSLVEKHSSGLSVLAAPGDFPSSEPTLEGIDKLIDIARQSFSYVVVDIGSRIDLMETTLFDESSTVYLITQVGISELRNSNRLISRYFSLRLRSLQIVLNRYTSKTLLFDDAQIAKALTRPANWKIPDDYATARRTESTGTPIALDNSPIAVTLRQMARAACGISDDKNKKKGFSLFKK
jgi:pilus assembly protein CpaE